MNNVVHFASPIEMLVAMGFLNSTVFVDDEQPDDDLCKEVEDDLSEQKHVDVQFLTE